MKAAVLISTIEQLLTADRPGAESILVRAALVEREVAAILAFTEVALAALAPDDPARVDLAEIRVAAERAINKLALLTAHARRPPQLRAV